MAKRANKSSRRRLDKRTGVGGASPVLPALSSLVDVPRMEELVPSERQRSQFSSERDRISREMEIDPQELHLGCVVRLDRGFPAVMSDRGLERCEFSAALTKGRGNSSVAVGDWVVARLPEGHDMGLLCKILERESDVARWKGRARGEKQTLAANVDVVLVVQPLGRQTLDCERIVRSAVIARDCGTDVAVVLTKVDRTDPEVLRRDLSLVRDVVGDEVKVVVTVVGKEASTYPTQVERLERMARDCGALWGVEGVRSLVPGGVKAIVLGESGAGKSTLLNALLGHEALETGAVRGSDDAGRHTTVARRMVSLPGAGVIVDEPGLRSLPIVGHERGLAKVFPEIAAAAASCRFRDCTHTHEPGCEVLARLAAKDFDSVRVKAYVDLASEMRESAGSLDPDVVL